MARRNRVCGSPRDRVPGNGSVLPVDAGAQGQAALDPYDRLAKFLDLMASIVARATAPDPESDRPDESCGAQTGVEDE